MELDLNTCLTANHCQLLCYERSSHCMSEFLSIRMKCSLWYVSSKHNNHESYVSNRGTIIPVILEAANKFKI
jgi:hypothetical protein